MDHMDILINVIIAIVSTLITWWISHCYYKKSLLNQAEHWLKIESGFLSQNKKDVQSDKLMLYEQRMLDVIQDYKKRGTPKYAIDTFSDLSKKEKAEMYDDVLLRVKGRTGKNNPYTQV